MMMGLSSCGSDDAKKAKDAANDAVEATTEAATEAAETTKEAVEATTEAAKDAVEGAADAAKEAVAEGVNGEELFQTNGCTACHQPTAKTVGPAVNEIAKAYAGKKDELVKFLKGEGQAIVDPAQFAVMKPNLEITKKMSDDKVAAIADYILSVK
jgi:cytochrome c551/c552